MGWIIPKPAIWSQSTTTAIFMIRPDRGIGGVGRAHKTILVCFSNQALFV